MHLLIHAVASRSRRRKVCAFALAVLVPLTAARAQNGTDGTDAADGADEASVTVEQLRKELARRDAVIVDLLDRVRALENGRGAAAGGRELAAAPAGETAQPDAARAADPASAGPDGPAAIDELLAERALERGLVQEGARLLPRGQVDIAPEVVMTHESSMFPTALMVGNDAVVGEVERTVDVYDTRASLRLGLPREYQLTVGVPYRFVRQKLGTSIDGMPESAQKDSGSGAGDMTIGLSKVLAARDASGATLIGELTWRSGSGDERDGAVYLGGGNSGATARLTANWRRDPLIFLLGGGYTYFDREGMIQLGDGYELTLGLGLAVSPDTALIFSINESSVNEIRRDGVNLPGTDRVASTLNLSASTTLGRRLLMRTDAGIGLTDDAPDFRLGLTFSSRLKVH